MENNTKPRLDVQTVDEQILITLNRAGLRNLLQCLAYIAGGESSYSSVVFADNKAVPVIVRLREHGSLEELTNVKP